MTTPAVNRVYTEPRLSDVALAGLDRATAKLSSLYTLRPEPAEERAAYARRLAELHRRRARWWAVLERSATDRASTHRVHRLAVIEARAAADEQVRFWLESARSWETTAARERTERGEAA